MSRYDIPPTSEGEHEPGSGSKVLRNLLGVTRPSLMHSLEDKSLEDVENNYLESGIVTADTQITAELICRMHKDWLGRVYEWAGEFRTVDMSKEGFAFPPAWLVPKNMADLESGILHERTPCRGETVWEIGLSLAVVHAELLLIHPFREGNGRRARESD